MAEGKYGKYIVTEFYDKFELPAGIKHGPITIRDVKRPLVHLIACDTGTYK